MKEQNRVVSIVSNFVFFILIFLLFFYAFVYPYLRSVGFFVAKHDSLSEMVTEEFFYALRERNISYIRSGSAPRSITHGGILTAYDNHSLFNRKVIDSVVYGKPIFTPHAHIIVHDNGVEVRYSEKENWHIVSSETSIRNLLDTLLLHIPAK